MLWMGFIFVLSNQPSEVSSEHSGMFVSPLQQLMLGVNPELLTFIVRKGAHIFAYYVLGVLSYNAFCHGWTRPYAKPVLWSCVLCILYAITDELHQLFVPGRSGEVRDVIIDSLAAVTGVWTCWYIKRKVPSKK